MDRGIPTRRKHGCDVCYEDTPTECFLGFNHDVLWICGDCYGMLTKKQEKKHHIRFVRPKL